MLLSTAPPLEGFLEAAISLGATVALAVYFQTLLMVSSNEARLICDVGHVFSTGIPSLHFQKRPMITPVEKHVHVLLENFHLAAQS